MTWQGSCASGSKGLAEIIAVTHAGMTTDEFAPIVEQWMTTAKHPQTGRLYTEMVYQPMVELLTFLRANGFKTFIASGGGVEFMRGWTERVYGIPPEQVIGSAGKVKFEMREGTPVLIKLPEIELFDDKEGKPIAIQSRIGRRPIAAFGNSDGDLQMLQWTMAGRGARFALFVHHDDAAREFAYDRPRQAPAVRSRTGTRPSLEGLARVPPARARQRTGGGLLVATVYDSATRSMLQSPSGDAAHGTTISNRTPTGR